MVGSEETDNTFHKARGLKVRAITLFALGGISQIQDEQKLTIGLDLGDRNSWYCVVDEAGRIRLEQRVRTSAKALQEVFGAMPRSRVVLEIGTHSPWIRGTA